MDEDVPVIVISVLVTVVLVGAVVCCRACIYNYIFNKKKARATNQPPPITPTQNNQIRSTSTEWTESDHQVIFARMPPPIHLRNPRLNAATPATQIIQEIEEQLQFDHLRIEYDRRAQERRNAFDRNNFTLHIPPSLNENTTVISSDRRTEINFQNAPIETFENNFRYSNPAPRYISQDEELPSYEAAIATINQR